MVKRTGVTVDIFSGYDTAQNGDIDEEVALIESTYENVKVSGRNQAHRRLRIPLESERRPGCRVTLVINIVPGYPYVLPGISLIFADSKDAEQLSAEEVAQIKTEVNETIQPCLSAGMPCILSIVSVVSGVLDNGVPVKAEAVAPRKAGSGGVATSPSLTPLPLRSKDARRLSLLTLHLLQKCCYMKESESREEANDVFEKLSRHLMHDIQLFPAEMKSFHRWNSAQFADDFRDEISDVFGPNADDPLKKWLWEDVGNAIKLQAGSEGRYAREFIEQQQLGAGSFAPVFVCRKKVDGRLYAIKKVAMRAKETQKVIGEVQTLSAFNHKNVVRYYDAWVEDGCDDDLRQFIESSGSESETDEDSQSDESTYSLSKSSDASTDLDEEAADEDSSLSSTTRSDHYQTLYIQMELCSGRSLRHLLDECNSQAGGIFNAVNGEKAAASVLRQLLRVTAHTHLENIAHRDLKPENVLLELNAHQDTGEIGTIRVADFGLARVVQSSCRRMASCLELSEAETPLALPEAGGTCGSESRGTVLYAAPEQEQGRSYGLKVDEFAIGMIAVEMWLAVAGKDFRERPSIMANIWRTGELPEWFSTWNPLIAAVISRLINADPAKRDSAEEVLKTANLPGDPVELSEALDIIDMYGEQMYGRVIQRIAQRTTDHYRKPPPKLCEEINFLGSAKCMEAVQAAHSVGMLHGCFPLEIYDPLVLTNPRLRSMGFDTHIDAKGRCFCHADTAQLSIAAFVGMQEHMIEPFYQFYHKARPFVTFTSPQPHEEPDVESHLEPLLCALHLLSTVEPAPSTITLIISHASWLNAVHPPEVGSRSPPTEMQRLKSVVDSAEKVAAAVSQIATVLASHGLPAAPRRDDFMRLVSTAIVELLRPMASAFHLNCSVVIDPGWIPDERLVMRAAVQTGLLIGLSTASTGDVAVGVSLDNFLSQCWVSKKAVKNAFSVTVDLKAPLMANQRFQLPDRDSIHMDGVALRSKDGLPYTTMATTAIQLWSGGIVACIRAEISSIHFKETLKAVRIRWILWDGRYITSSRQFDKNVVKGEQLSLDDVRAAVRRLGTSATADDKSNGGKLGDPLFLCGAVDTKSHSRIVELFTSVWGSKASPPLVVDAGVAEVDALIRRMEVDDRNVDLPASSGGGMPELLQWLRQNSSCGIVGIYSLADGRLVFFAHPRRVRAVTQPNKDKGSTKKKSHR